MSGARTFLVGVLGLLLLAALPGTAAAAAPHWTVSSVALPTNFKSGDLSGTDGYEVVAANNGGGVTEKADPIVISDTLPAGLEVKKLVLPLPSDRPSPPGEENGIGFFNYGPEACATQTVGEVSTVTCTITESLPESVDPTKLLPNEEVRLLIEVATPASVSGPLENRSQVEGGGAPPATAVSHNEANSGGAARAGFQLFRTELTDDDGTAVTAAGTHPFQYTTSFAVNTVPNPALAAEPNAAPFIPAEGDLKDIEVALPPGLVGNPTATLRCTAKQFNSIQRGESPTGGALYLNDCPDGSAIGLILIQQLEGLGGIVAQPIYNLVPPKGMPAQLGFQIVGAPFYIDTSLRSGSESGADFGISAHIRNTTEAKRVTAASVVIWGTPAEAVHDPLRGRCLLPNPPLSGSESCSAETAVRPFFRLPTSCANPLLAGMGFNTWVNQGAFVARATSSEPAPVGCAALDFSPRFEAEPTTHVADSPTGLKVDLHIPQREHENPGEPGEADLRNAIVTLPPRLIVNPASADGLSACSPAQVGLTSPIGSTPIEFSEEPATCPPASKIGTVQVRTPLLDHPLDGGVYLASQDDNPFRSLLAIYLALDDPQTGIVVKLAGRVEPDPRTGQLTTTFEDNPQLPFEDFELEFFGGSRASLRTPMRCGDYASTTDLKPWSAPQSGPDATPSSPPFSISAGPGGSCPSGALQPKLSAGLQNPTAGTYSPFLLRLTRDDATGEFAGLTATPPLGFAAKLAGIPYCSQTGIAQARSREHPGAGAQEISSPSCPAASQVGTITAGAGAGPSPYYVSGKLYLAGPYKGAPLSLVAIIPAVAGPFDLGVVVNRVASYVDPETAQVKAAADPLPTVLSGILIDARDLRVNLDRPDFALAPTSCEPKSVGATVQGTSGDSVDVSDRFQVGGCAALKFKPKVSLRLKGGTKRNRNPALKAVVSYPQGGGAYANTAKVSVALPHSEFLDNAHFRTICTRVQFAANACPKGSIYGRARAFTPLFDKPLEGPVYLRSSSNLLPDMVLDLHGQVNIVAVARIDSHKGGIRSSFEAVPDAPLSRVVVEMQGGKKGLFVNSRDICKHVNRATARFVAQNGKTFRSRPVLKNSSCRKHGKHKRHGRHKHK